MINSEREIYIQETEVKPNKYATLVLSFCVVIVVICWVLDEIGIFRVGKFEMRIGTIITFISSLIPLLWLLINKNALNNKATKYMVVLSSCVFTCSVGTLLTFHTTIMLLFPMFMAMLYRSKAIGIIAAVASFSCTIVTPVMGYIFGTWDIALFQELILIGTDETVVLSGGLATVTWVGIGKIVLYIVFPRLLMVGSCALLMFYNIKIGVDHVNNQIMLNQISHRDSLTGLYNQNYYREIIKESKKDETVGVVFFDVNDLKLLNDTKGHEYGDLLLKRSAQSVLHITDETSRHAFRIGGDEFLLIVENATYQMMAQIIEEWKESLRTINHINEIDYDGLKCSMAYGFTIGKLSKIDELVKIADENMYHNKAQIKSASLMQNNKENEE